MTRPPVKFSQLVKLAIAGNDVFAASALHKWANNDERPVLEALIRRQRRNTLLLAQMDLTPPSVLAYLANLNDTAVLIRLAKHANTPSVVLEKLYFLSQHDENKKRLPQLLGRNKSTPRWVLAQMAQSESDMMALKEICANTGADSEVLKMAAERGMASLRTLLSVNQATDSSLLKWLWNDACDPVRAQILGHQNCPQELLDKIPDTTLQRRKLASNPRVPSDVLQILAGDSEWSVRRVVAGNPSLPAESLDRLTCDTFEAVRRVVASRTDLSAKCVKALAADKDEWVRQWVARNPATSPRQLYALSTDNVADVRRAVARNKACTLRLVEKLASDSDAWVRAGIAYRRNLPSRLLRLLETDIDNIDVLSGVAQNQGASQRTLKKLAIHPNPDVRRGVILNKNANRTVARKLLCDPYGLNRFMALSHPSLLDRDRWQLWQDREPQIRFSVFNHFANYFRGESPGNPGQSS